MAHMPDMTYPENGLSLTHSSSITIDFNVLDALSPVIIKSIGLPNGMKVGPSEAWLKSRTNSEYVSKVHNAAFDWTFTTDYPGTLNVPGSIQEGSNDRIDFDRLTRKDKILWFKEIDLFEDELADHGTAGCSVKIRVMETCFFVLLRYFLRIDNVFVRFYDTRYYHEFGKDFVVRERTINEANIPDLKLDDEHLYMLVTPHELYNVVPQTSLAIDKINLSKL